MLLTIFLAGPSCGNCQYQLGPTKCFAMIVGRQPSFDVKLSIERISVPYVTSSKDLGVTVCSSFNNSSHIANIVSITGQRSQLLLTSFASRDVKILTRAFITYVRPILEYNYAVWSPHNITDITAPERVQRRFTKRLPGLRNLTYTQRLQKVGLCTLEFRRLIIDLVTCYKIVFAMTCLKYEEFVTPNPVNTTRGHPYKLYVPCIDISMQGNISFQSGYRTLEQS